MQPSVEPGTSESIGSAQDQLIVMDYVWFRIYVNATADGWTIKSGLCSNDCRCDNSERETCPVLQAIHSLRAVFCLRLMRFFSVI